MTLSCRRDGAPPRFPSLPMWLFLAFFDVNIVLDFSNTCCQAFTLASSSPLIVRTSSPSFFHDRSSLSRWLATVAKDMDDYSVLEDDDDDDDDGMEGFNVRAPGQKVDMLPDFSMIEDDDHGNHDEDIRDEARKLNMRSRSTNRPRNEPDNQREPPQSPIRPRRPGRILKRKVSSNMAGTSWMEKNSKFTNDKTDAVSPKEDLSRSNEWNRSQRSIADTKTFRQDFRRTRVFVKGIPSGASWQDLKDHFRVAGNVVFASVSVDVATGESKGHGIVQFETTEMAQKAIDIMRDHPLDGHSLFVREDVQESKNPDAQLRTSSSPAGNGSTPPTKWKCANEDNAAYISEEDLASIRSLIKARDDARRRRKYEVSDRIRDELKSVHGVFIDDRLRMWWTAVDGNKVPQSIHDIKGEGGWKLKPWRQIPTTPENDACVSRDFVEGLLKQRDIARREKDFATADALLEEARTSPDGDLNLRIHDESRTWRVWTDSIPSANRRSSMSSDPEVARKAAGSECIAIVKEHAPHKLNEIAEVLKRFPGREFQVLKRLKQQYL